MALFRCRLCGELKESGSMPPRHKICKSCRHRLDDLYGRVHEYMRDNEDEKFDIYELGEAMDISTADIQALVDLGYIERDLQTYGQGRTTDRERLAAEFNEELKKIKQTPTSYGGTIYSRDKSDDRHYLFDKQKKK